ncbi:MAG: hypothetical protein AB7I30_05560 [Isosphaeraceae bacterium]
MPESTHPTLPAPFPTPDARTRNVVTLLLRLGVGLPLLNSGLKGFWMVRSGRSSPFGTGSSASFVSITGMDGIYLFLPYAEIVIGLAVLVGFLTIAAVAASVALSLLPMLLYALAMITSGGAIDSFGPRGNVYYAIEDALTRSGSTGTLLVGVVLIWLASVGWNGWSLDGMMFQPRRDHAEPGVVAPSRTNPPVS